MTVQAVDNRGFVSLRAIKILALYTLLTGISLRFDVYLGDLSKTMGALVLCIALYFAWKWPYTAILSVLFFYSAVVSGANSVGLFRLNEDGAVFLVIVAWYSAFRKGRLLPHPWLVYGFYLFAIGGSLVSVARPLYNVDFFLVVVLSILGIRLVTTESEVRECVLGAWLASFLVALSGLYFGVASTPTGDLATRAAVAGHDQNYFSLFAGLALILSIAIIVNWQKRLSRWAIIGLLVSNIPVFLALSRQGSRGFLVAAILPLLASIIAVRKNAALLATSMVCVGASVYLFMFTSVGDVWQERFRDETMETGGGRLEVFATAGNILSHSEAMPFLFGSGYGSSFELIGAGLSEVTEFSSHNSWLAVLIEGGVFGFACYTGFFALLFIRFRKCGSARCITALCILLYLAGQSMSLEPHRTTVFWLVLTIAYAQTHPKLRTALKDRRRAICARR